MTDPRDASPNPLELTDAERREVTDVLLILARHEADDLDDDLEAIAGSDTPVLVTGPIYFELVWRGGWRVFCPIDAVAAGVALRRRQADDRRLASLN